MIQERRGDLGPWRAIISLSGRVYVEWVLKSLRPMVRQRVARDLDSPMSQPTGQVLDDIRMEAVDAA